MNSQNDGRFPAFQRSFGLSWRIPLQLAAFFVSLARETPAGAGTGAKSRRFLENFRK
jgi:hypothetical protein